MDTSDTLATTAPVGAPIVAPTTTPPVATTTNADVMVAVSKGLAQLVAFAKANPELMALLQQQFGTQLANAAHTTAGSFVGAILGWVFAHFGIQADPTLTVSLCGAGVLAGSVVWNVGVAVWRRAFGDVPTSPAQIPTTKQKEGSITP